MSRWLISIFFSTFIVFSFSPAQAKIEWELSFPFRQMGKLSFKKGQNKYFSDQRIGETDWAFRRHLYVDDGCIGKQHPILCSERRVGPNRFKKMMNTIGIPGKARWGHVKSNAWIAEGYLDRGNFYSGSKYRYLRNYVRSIEKRNSDGKRLRHRIRVWLDLPEFADQQCEFRVDGGPWYPGSCSEGTRLSVVRGEKTSWLEARVAGVDKIYRIDGTATKVREVVIAAIGDSYASGEGVPDIPARVRFADDLIKRRAAQGSKEPIYDNAAHWVERNCHRSYLSSQARAAIHYAVTHPKSETILLHTACSGAEVISGLLGPYSGASETNYHKRNLERAGEAWLTTLGQYNQLVLALCHKPDVAGYKREFNRYFARPDVKRSYRKGGRNLPLQTNKDNFFGPALGCRGGFKLPIDALLIGVGGNDVGFFNVVTHGLLELGSLRTVAKSMRPEEAGSTARRLIRPLYKLLDKANQNRLGVKRDQVIISAYPIGVEDSDGKFCNSREGLGSFNVFASLTGLRIFKNIVAPKVTRNESRALHDEFGKVLNREIAESVREHSGWRLSDDHVTNFKTHGWCAGDATLTRTDAYNPYVGTQRYIRTPDDGWASQHRLPADFEKKRSKILNQMLKTYGLMHPNGRGAAVIADSYYRHLVKVLDSH